MIIQYREVPSFSTLLFRGPGELEIVQSDVQSLCIEASGEHLGQIFSRVVDEQLVLGINVGSVVDLSAYQQPIRLRLAVQELHKLTVTGRSTVSIPDMDCDDLSLLCAGSANVKIDQLTADQLLVVLKNRSQASIKGDVEYQTINLSDEATFAAENLISDGASIRLTGAAQAQIRTTDELDAYIAERSHLTYIGYPEVKKRGAGKIARRRKQLTVERGKEHG